MMELLKNSKDNRFFNDRRNFTYAAHVPERRSGTDRRNVEADKFNVSVA